MSEDHVMPDTPAAAVQIPAAGTYRLDPAASSVSFATRHLFGLAGVGGTFSLVSGEITIADPVTASTASAVIDAASFATGSGARDKDVKSANFLHVHQHPRITFASTGLVRDGDSWRLRGQITARGHAAPAELTITEARTDPDGFVVRMTTRVDRYAHGITKKKGMAGRYLDLDITARATRAR
jgi:polyisoprenoid-binding protein YceI